MTTVLNEQDRIDVETKNGGTGVEGQPHRTIESVENSLSNAGVESNTGDEQNTGLGPAAPVAADPGIDDAGDDHGPEGLGLSVTITHLVDMSKCEYWDCVIRSDRLQAFRAEVVGVAARYTEEYAREFRSFAGRAASAD